MSTDTNANSGTEREHIPESVLDELREAGVSHLFIQVIQTLPEDAGVARNSSRDEILKYMKWAEESENGVTDYLGYGGGFFQNLRLGTTGGADRNNQAIVSHVRNQGAANTSTGVVDL